MAIASIPEEWRPVVGYEGLYDVSSHGRVRSLRSFRRQANRILKQAVKNGYWYLTLRRPGEGQSCYVHRLVATAFLPQGAGRSEVNHKDGNRANNCAKNLEWVTRRENVRHAMSTGLSRWAKGEAAGKSKLTEAQVLWLCANENTLNKRQLAEHVGITQGSVELILRGRTWGHVTGRKYVVRQPRYKRTASLPLTSERGLT